MTRAAAASERRFQRSEKLRLRDLERQLKQDAKRSELEQARLEVDEYEAQLDVILSVHKDASEPMDWSAVAAALRPAPPIRNRTNELRAKQYEILASAGLNSFRESGHSGAASDGRQQDDRDFEAAQRSHVEADRDWQEQKHMAQRILSGDVPAYREALSEVNPFADSPDVCAALGFTVHSRHLVECVLTVKGMDIIPAEVKTLTSTGKLSVKTMPKSRFHEVFQDYVCGCALRAAREVLAIVPVDVVLVTASVLAETGREMSVLSVAIPRVAFDRIDFTHIDPSDTIEAMHHRGDLRVSKKTGSFAQIVPLTPADLLGESAATATVDSVVASARVLDEDILALIASLAEHAPVRSATEGEDA
jgi:hypothetical protein